MEGKATLTRRTTPSEIPDPHLRGTYPGKYLPRPRLDRLWDEWESRRVVVIEAPAGYGKTTLLAANFRRSGRRVFWFTFGSFHAGLSTLLESLGSVAGPTGSAGATPDPAEPDRQQIDHRHTDPRHTDPRWIDHRLDASTILVHLIDAIRSTREGWNIVLDDLHRAAANGGAGQGTRTGARRETSTNSPTATPSALTTFLDDLIDSLPAGSTLFLASREPIGIRRNKLRLQEQAVIVTAEDLRFTQEETVALFRARVPEQLPDPQDLERIAAKIEGWPAGLGICLQYIEGSPGRHGPEPSLQRVLDRIDAGAHVVAGKVAHLPTASAGVASRPGASPDGPSWFSYFAEEVLASLDPPIARFLMQASILPTLNPSLCDDVLGIRNSRALLQDLHRRNLFTFPIASAETPASIAPVAPLAAIARETAAARYAPTSPAETSYRFHPLFQDFLARRLEATIPDRQVRALRGRAARRLLREGAWAEAMVLLIDAGDAPSVLRLLERRGPAILHAGHAAILLRAFAAMDPRDYAARPRALFVLGSIHEAQGRPDEAEAAFEQALHGLRSAPRRDPRLRLELTTLLLTLKVQRGRHLEAIRLCREALTTRSWTNLRAWARLVVMLGGCLSELGRCDEAEKEFRRAGDAYARHGDAAGEAQIQFLLAACIHHPRGELGEARAGIRRALEYFRGVGDLGIGCHCCATLAFLMIEDGDEGKARDLAMETLRQAESFRLPEVAGLCHVTLGRCGLLRARGGGAPKGGRGALEDREDAAAHFAAALEIGEAIAHTDLNIYPRLGLAAVALDRGNLPLAREHAAAALAHARRRHVRFGMAQACVLLGSIEGALASASPGGPHPPARTRWWRRAERILRAMGARWHLHRLLLLRWQADAAVDATAAGRGDDSPGAAGVLSGAPAPGTPPALLHELLAGIVPMRHESLLLTHERVAGVAALGAVFRLGIMRKDAAELLLRLGEDAIPELRKGLEDPDRRTRKACADLIARIGGDEARRALGPHKHPTTTVGRVAIRAHLDSMRRPAPPLRICALGPLRVGIGDRIVSPDDWPSVPAMRVFLFLLLHRFRTVERDTIIEALWPDERPTPARHGFSQAIHILRRVLEPDLPAHQPSRYLRTSVAEARLDPGDGATYDVTHFENGMAGAATPTLTGKEAAITIERLQKTLALYRGDFAEALPDEKCMEVERRRLRDLWVRGASRLLTLLAARHAWTEMIPLADLAVTRDPSVEKFHYHLITAYHESGNRSAAVRAYRRYEKIVYADPLAHLSPQVRELFDRIRAS